MEEEAKTLRRRRAAAFGENVGWAAAVTKLVRSATGLPSESMLWIVVDSQLHLPAYHFHQKIDLVRLGELAHGHIHIVDNLRIRR